jgi:hypothetical protein
MTTNTKQIAEQRKRVPTESELNKMMGWKPKLPEFPENIQIAVHSAKNFATNMIGYSKLLRIGEYGKLSKKQRDTLGIVVEEGDYLIASLTELSDLVYKYKRQNKNKEIKEHMIDIGIICEWFLRYEKLSKKEKDMMRSIKKNADDARKLI